MSAQKILQLGSTLGIWFWSLYQNPDEILSEVLFFEQAKVTCYCTDDIASCCCGDETDTIALKSSKNGSITSNYAQAEALYSSSVDAHEFLKKLCFPPPPCLDANLLP